MIKKLFNNKYFVILFIVTILLIVGMIFSINRSYETTASDNLIIKITMPVQKFFSGIAENVKGFFSYFGDTAELNNENERLSAEIEQLKAELAQIKSNFINKG